MRSATVATLRSGALAPWAVHQASGRPISSPTPATKASPPAGQAAPTPTASATAATTTASRVSEGARSAARRSMPRHPVGIRRPACSVVRSVPAAASSRIDAYSDSACATSSRDGLVRTDM